MNDLSGSFNKEENKAIKTVLIAAIMIVLLAILIFGLKPVTLKNKKQEKRMYLETLIVGDLGTNCYIVATEHGSEAIIIDPGDDAGIVMDTVAAKELDVKYIILTHGHWDHFGALKDIASETGAKVAIHKLDVQALKEPNLSLAAWLGEKQEEIKPDLELEEGQIIKFGELEAKVLHTPGHSAGSISLLIADSLFTGDLLFYGSIGRTDFIGGSYESLIKSVREKVFTLPDHVRVYPGHGPATTVGNERKNNPFFQ